MQIEPTEQAGRTTWTDDLARIALANLDFNTTTDGRFMAFWYGCRITPVPVES